MFGTVRKWRGHCGYVEPVSGSAPSVFIHRNDMPDETRRLIRNGREIEFDVTPDPRGPRAANVRIVR